ncbi:DUF5994 family protein [Streptomyces sp. NPDC007088]|uniref:DUF5994 family protein n=1 Tax=Streptomyces sp. NPDC007088 TaxID=3364773 RepID=UPI0036AB9986
MSATNVWPPSTLSVVPGPPAGASASPRLSLKDPDAPRGLLDGAWWPRSRDLTREIPQLVEALDSRWGRITRIAVNSRTWPAVPRRIAVPGHIVKVGWFTAELDPNKLLLLSYDVGRWDLLVVPPGTEPAVAARLMAAASDASGPALTATEHLAVCLPADTPLGAAAPVGPRRADRRAPRGHEDGPLVPAPVAGTGSSPAT